MPVAELKRGRRPYVHTAQAYISAMRALQEQNGRTQAEMLAIINADADHPWHKMSVHAMLLKWCEAGVMRRRQRRGMGSPFAYYATPKAFDEAAMLSAVGPQVFASFAELPDVTLPGQFRRSQEAFAAEQFGPTGATPLDELVFETPPWEREEEEMIETLGAVERIPVTNGHGGHLVEPTTVPFDPPVERLRDSLPPVLFDGRFTRDGLLFPYDQAARVLQLLATVTA